MVGTPMQFPQCAMPLTTPAKRERSFANAELGARNAESFPTPAASSFRVPRFGDRPEARRVQREHRPRAHRENVADDSAHARRRALERLDGARVFARAKTTQRLATNSHRFYKTITTDPARAAKFSGTLHVIASRTAAQHDSINPVIL